MPDKVLLVCSSTAANIQKAREILRRRTSFDRPEFHLLCSPSDLPYLQKAPPARRVWVFPHRRDLGKGFRLWLRILRQRYRAVAVLWCGDRARQRPKLFALACGGRRILVFDERLECSRLNASLLGRLLAARARRRRWNAGPVADGCCCRPWRRWPGFWRGGCWFRCASCSWSRRCWRSTPAGGPPGNPEEIHEGARRKTIRKMSFFATRRRQ